MIFLGCDPDLHCTAIARVDGDGGVIHVQTVKAKGSTGREAVLDMIGAFPRRVCFAGLAPILTAVAVESQEIAYTARQGANPRDLILLANISGAFIANFTGSNCPKLYFPSPQGWKGSVPKQIHQARVLTRVGWSYAKAGSDTRTGYCYPVCEEAQQYQLNKGDWKHAVDALGLALWARDQYLKGVQK